MPMLRLLMQEYFSIVFISNTICLLSGYDVSVFILFVFLIHFLAVYFVPYYDTAIVNPQTR